MSTTKSEIKGHQQFIAGRWTGAADGRSFDDLDPFTGEKEAVARANATSCGLGTNRRCLLAESTTADTDGLAARR